MQIIFKKDEIKLTGEREASYSLKELNAEKIIDLLENCILYENGLEFSEEENNSPISHKLKELIENALNQTKDSDSI